MKKIILLTGLLAFGTSFAQTDAFKGQGDKKVNIGATFQDGGTGIQASLDYGLGQSFSLGAQAGYLLGVHENSLLGKPKFGDRIDLKIRASAHLAEVVGLPENLDLYPGLNLSLKNFGGHVGTRYFFDKGFGVFGELQFPISRYNEETSHYDYLNNQFNITLGVSFDLN